MWLPCGTLLKDMETIGVTGRTTSSATADWKKCTVKCTDDPACQMWSYKDGKCYLHETPGTGIRAATGTQTGSRNCNDFCTDGYDLTSTDESSVITESNVATADACRAKCAESVTCERFAWTSSTKACRLIDFDKVSGGSSKAGVVSGPWHCTVQPTANCPESVDLSCEYMRKIFHTQMTWEKCAAHCKADPNCKYWVFGPHFKQSFHPYAPPASGGIPCFLYDTDAGRTVGSGVQSGSVKCQAKTTASGGAENTATKHLPKPYRRPFVDCLHQGMKLPTGSTGSHSRKWCFTMVRAWPTIF